MNLDINWWIATFEIPAMAGLLWLIWRTRIDCDHALDHLHDSLERRSDQLRDVLSAFKLEVAKTYASHMDLRELEARLVGHLLRIESKLGSVLK